MDCGRFQEFLAGYLESSLEIEEYREMQEHARNCRDCRQLVAAACGTVDYLQEEDARLLRVSILERTTGLPCAAARRALKHRRRIPMPPIEATLVALHLHRCAQCSEYASRPTLFADGFAGLLLLPHFARAASYLAAVALIAFLAAWSSLFAGRIDVTDTLRSASIPLRVTIAGMARTAIGNGSDLLQSLGASFEGRMENRERAVRQDLAVRWRQSQDWLGGNLGTMARSRNKALSVLQKFWISVLG
jgi:hypothetical protein